MKYVWFALVVVVIAVLSYFIVFQQSSLELWAQNAPLEKVSVQPGQNVTELIDERVPANVRAHGDMSYAITVIGGRQGKQLGRVGSWEEILLPIRYQDWTGK
jgi:hypothetical protein